MIGQILLTVQFILKIRKKVQSATDKKPRAKKVKPVVIAEGTKSAPVIENAAPIQDTKVEVAPIDVAPIEEELNDEIRIIDNKEADDSEKADEKA